jgi:hypothetical protein
MSDDGGRDALAELTVWLREAVSEAGLTHRVLAAQIYQHPSGVTKALSGSALPPSWLMTRAIANACHADPETARRLWEVAHHTAMMRTRHVADGWPPDDLADHDDLCRALAMLVTLRHLSLREVVDRDSSSVLTRSMTGYVLRAERRVTYRAMIAIITACGVPPGAYEEWRAAWWRLAPPEIEARRKAQLEGLRASQGGRLIWMGRSW